MPYMVVNHSASTPHHDADLVLVQLLYRCTEFEFFEHVPLLSVHDESMMHGSRSEKRYSNEQHQTNKNS